MSLPAMSLGDWTGRVERGEVGLVHPKGENRHGCIWAWLQKNPLGGMGELFLVQMDPDNSHPAS